MRGIPNFKVTGPKQAWWKFHCHIAIKQKDGACLATAIIHASAIFKGKEQPECFYENDASNLDTKGDRYSIKDTLAVASKFGYIGGYFEVTSFEQYKEVVKLYPILLGHDMFNGMTGAGKYFNGLLAPTFGVLRDDKGRIRKHVALLLGRDPGWKWWPFKGRYSCYKNSAGPDWGGRFGEAKITDGELEDLIEIGHVKMFAVIK